MKDKKRDTSLLRDNPWFWIAIMIVSIGLLIYSDPSFNLTGNAINGLNTLTINIANTTSLDTFTSLDISVKNKVTKDNLRAEIKRVDKPTYLPEIANASVLRYVSVSFLNIKKEDIAGMNISFEVRKDELLSKQLSPDTVQIYRYFNGWKKLPLEKISEGTETYNFKTTSEKASLFAITASELAGGVPKPAPVIKLSPFKLNQNSIIVITAIIILLIIGIILSQLKGKPYKAREFVKMKILASNTAGFIGSNDLIGGIKEYNKLKENFHKYSHKLLPEQVKEIYNESIRLNNLLVKLNKIQGKSKFA